MNQKEFNDDGKGIAFVDEIHPKPGYSMKPPSITFSNFFFYLFFLCTLMC